MIHSEIKTQKGRAVIQVSKLMSTPLVTIFHESGRSQLFFCRNIKAAEEAVFDAIGKPADNGDNKEGNNVS